jgi:hypothetical protein
MLLFVVAPFVKRGEDVWEEVRWDADVGVADDEYFVFCEAFEFDEFGDFGVGASERSANDELAVCGRKFCEKFADDWANGIVDGGDAEEDLDWAGVILGKPSAQGGFGGRIGVFERFEECDGGKE